MPLGIVQKWLADGQDQTRPSAYPGTFIYVGLGDSSYDDFGLGSGGTDYDGVAVSTGIRVLKKGVAIEGDGGTTTWDANNGDGMDSYLSESLLALSGVSSVKGISRAVTGSRHQTHWQDQLSDAKRDLVAESIDPTDVDLVVHWGAINDISANGSAATGEWNNGEAMAQWNVEERYYALYRRIRAVCPTAVIVFVLPTTARSASDAATYYPSGADLDAGIRAVVNNLQADGDTNVRFAETWDTALGFEGVLTMRNSKHIDPDDATKGAQAATDLIIGEYYTP